MWGSPSASVNRYIGRVKFVVESDSMVNDGLVTFIAGGWFASISTLQSLHRVMGINLLYYEIRIYNR